ncbi:MAG: PfkB family carbohydrate kinase [Treponema sp.]|jgi:fructose-1-phosphate kinase PfkB-like protein|nr:PfkB family carbohydrate kinase [Treponema sp.]
MSFLTVCLNPTIQKTLCFSSITPGAVNRAAAHRLDVSGKGINVTRVLTQLGKKTVHLTQLGGIMRPLLLSLCEQDGLTVEWAESGSEIRFCYTVLNEKSGAVTELIEGTQPVAPDTEKLLMEKFDEIIAPARVQDSSSSRGVPRCLIISGTKAAGFSDMLIPGMVMKAKEKGLMVILDIKENDLINSLKYEPDVIKPNLDEFLHTFGPGTDIETDLNGFVQELARKYRCSVIITNGSRKVIAAGCAHRADACGARTAGGGIFTADVTPVKAVNTTGCGDAFTAGLAAALAEGAELKAAIAEGMRCGALNAALVRPGVIR